MIGADRPLAVQVAQPLFKAGLRTAGITEKINYNSSPNLPVKTMPMHVFTLLLQGELGMEVGKTTTWIKPGDLVYTPPGSPHRRIGKLNSPVWFLYIDFFDIAEWDALKNAEPFSRCYQEAPLMFHLLRNILDIHRTRVGIRSARANATALLELIRKEIPDAEATPGFRRQDLEKLLEKIRQHPNQGWNISVMAEQLHVSRATLNRLFLSEFGIPPKTMIINLRMSLACEFLIKTNATVTDIATRVGYESAFTFSNLFLKHAGLRPGAFRKKHQHLVLDDE